MSALLWDSPPGTGGIGWAETRGNAVPSLGSDGISAGVGRGGSGGEMAADSGEFFHYTGEKVPW